MGPISLKRIPGAGWPKLKRPERLRATYNQKEGTYISGAPDVHRDCLYAQLRVLANPGTDRNGARPRPPGNSSNANRRFDWTRRQPPITAGVQRGNREQLRTDILGRAYGVAVRRWLAATKRSSGSGETPRGGVDEPNGAALPPLG
jgi:hypothetical protein